MSEWTYIDGTIRLARSVYAGSGRDRNLHLPYPKEQMTLVKKNPNRYSVYIHSLPIIDRIIKDAIGILPNGEWENIEYNLFQTDRMYSLSSSSLDEFIPDEEKTFKSILKESGLNDKEIENTKPYGVYYVTESVLTISDSVRYCDGPKMMSSLLEFFMELAKHKIYVEGGHIEWHDNVDEYKYTLDFGIGSIICSIVGKNGVVFSKKTITFNVDSDEDEHGEVKIIVSGTESINWKAYIPHDTIVLETNK